MFRYTTHTFKKIQSLLKELGYQVRVGKGNFNSGYCVLEHKKVVVINRFHSVETQIISMMEIVSNIEVDADKLSPQSLSLYEKVLEEHENRVV